MPKLPKHILVIRLSAMGDVAMTIPLLRLLTSQYTDVKITVLTRALFAPFFRDLPNVSVFAADVKGKHKGVLGLYRLSKELKALNIDAIADLHNVLRSTILKRFLSKIPFVQIDKGRAEKKALVSGENFTPLKTTHARYAEVFEALGFPLNKSSATVLNVANLSKQTTAVTGEKNSKWVGIAPFATHKSKMYPLEKMAQVIAQLSKDYKIMMFGGGKDEIKILNELEQTIHNTVTIAGKLSLDQELDVISNLDVMVSMDSGNAHIAAMLGKKVITIWGVTHPYAGFAPYNQPESNALLADRAQYPKIPTSVYGNKFPEGYENAAGSISPESIVEKVKSIII